MLYIPVVWIQRIHKHVFCVYKWHEPITMEVLLFRNKKIAKQEAKTLKQKEHTRISETEIVQI